MSRPSGQPIWIVIGVQDRDSEPLAGSQRRAGYPARCEEAQHFLANTRTKLGCSSRARLTSDIHIIQLPASRARAVACGKLAGQSRLSSGAAPSQPEAAIRSRLSVSLKSNKCAVIGWTSSLLLLASVACVSSKPSGSYRMMTKPSLTWNRYARIGWPIADSSKSVAR